MRVEDPEIQKATGKTDPAEVMGKLRDLYAAADYSTAILEAAIRKAGIHIAPFPTGTGVMGQKQTNATNGRKNAQEVTTVEDLVDAGRRMEMAQMPPPPRTLTPPPDHGSDGLANGRNVTDEEVARRLETFLASTPPESDNSSAHSHHNDTLTDTSSLIEGHRDTQFTSTAEAFLNHNADEFKLISTAVLPEFEQDEFDALLNFDAMAAGGDASWNFDDGGIHGFTVDMDWLGGSVGGKEKDDKLDAITIAA